MLLTSNDRWVVIGPGRTGSRVIVDLITAAYHVQGMELRNLDPTTHSVPGPLEILHTHEVQDLEHIDPGSSTRYVLSTRDTVDSSLSWCIQPHLGAWHTYNERRRSLSHVESRRPSLLEARKSGTSYVVKPFHLDPEEFMCLNDRAQNFYPQVSASPWLPAHTIKIDYSDISRGIQQVLPLLGIPKINWLSLVHYLPQKNPGRHREWISNWDEIARVCETLNRNPLVNNIQMNLW